MNSPSNHRTRRSIVQGAGVAIGAGVIGSMHAEAAQNTAPTSPRALALIGDRFHNSDYIRVGLDRIFEEVGIAIDYTIAYDKLSASQLQDYQLLLIMRDGQVFPKGYLGPDRWSDYSANLEPPKAFAEPKAVMWMTEEQGLAIKNFVSAGNGLYAIHNASHISLSCQNYRDVMGGAFVQHPPLRPFQVRPTANRHPITDGISPFVVTDEQHYVVFDKDPRHIILESENLDGLELVCGAPKVCESSRIKRDPDPAYTEGTNLGTKSVAGWAYDYGKGRMVFTAVGHDIHAMWSANHLEIQKRSVRWLLKQI